MNLQIKTKEKGLTSDEVLSSRKKYGANVLPRGKKKSFFRRYIEGFSDPIIKILLGALFLNIIFSIGHTDLYETGGIIAAVLISTVVSAISEHGSERAFEKLSERGADEECRVRRDGEIVKLKVSEIVVGDIVIIGAGERIPADGILVSGAVSIDQSTLNGEAREEKKTPVYPIRERMTLSPDMKDSLLCGSSVVAGSGEMEVFFVGGETIYGNIATSLSAEKRESPLKHRLSELAKNVSTLGYTASAMVFVAFLFRAFFIENGMDINLAIADIKNPSVLFSELLSALTLAISVIVVAVPEGLPMMITVVLSSNMKRMLNDNVLIKKLVGIETAGSLNILFCDKTGTLTRGDLRVTKIISADGEYKSVSKMRKNNSLHKLFVASCLYNTDSKCGYEKNRHRKKIALGGNATDRALLDAVIGEVGSAEIKNVTVGKKVPFDSKNKYSAATVTIDGEKLTFVKGAPEKIIEKCGYELGGDGVVRKFSSKDEILGKYRSLAASGARLIAAAFIDGDRDDPLSCSLTFMALVSISDEERPEALGAVKEIRSAGISVVMITGDGEETASAIAKRVGILDREKHTVISGKELRRLSDDDVKSLLPTLAVICRALPSDKERLVRISQSMGLVVGMTGDGVNDAPALKVSDVGFALGGGTEVAKEAGDIVILDNNIKSICRAILYGRTIFDSIRKFIVFQLTMNLCAVGVSVIGPFIGVEAPVTVIQMLWVNLIMDTLGGLAFAGEAPRSDYMREPPKRRDEKILSSEELSRVFITGGFAVLCSLLYLKLPFFREAFGYENDYLRFITVFFAMFVFCGIFMAFNCRTTRLNLFSYLGKNPAFILIMTVTATVQLLIVYFGGSVFRTTPLSAHDVLYALLFAFSVVPFDLLRKFISKKANSSKKVSKQTSKP